jgi:hypothetical protein
MKCAVCGSEALSRDQIYSSFETHVRVKGAGSGWLIKDLVLKPERARVCLDCGHVMLFLGAPDLRRLKDT